jgi:class 3 adenylate cyclase/tetratricopeptide (TPR) repeat protein
VLICARCGRETPEGFPRCANCGATLDAPAAREVRKTVTVLFCDITGSTALGESTDPEALRALLARYFERMKAIVESHGGVVEKFIGDAVMALFGAPVAHEDDALRACRAAVEMREAFPALGLNGRIGVNTGEVVTGTEERLATGDAVNVAARLEQAAAPGQVLIGSRTLALVASAVDVEPVEPLTLKGKSEPVPAYRLLQAKGMPERRFSTPMIGREQELQQVGDAFARALRDRSCQLLTVLGSAGVGKSRLAAEFLAGADARILRGRCLSYGDGITYWPVVEILKQAGTLPAGDAARPLRGLLGESDEIASAREIAWGVRKLLEQEAQAHPVVCVFDDLHWAEKTLLDLVEHVAAASRDAPILLFCTARPELLERRPTWGTGARRATTVLLEPLDAAESAELLAALGDAPEALHERIVDAAEGNPLFLEEMLALVRGSPDGNVDVPPTIQALLAARLDQLDPAERSVLERGAIEGRTFHRGAVSALSDEAADVDEQLLALVRKELIRPDRPQLPLEQAYRFRHQLIRDAAYDALPKAVRADLHQRLAGWLETHGHDFVELEEILGLHLEQAARYLAELGRPDPAVAGEASTRLAAAGERARWRGDASSSRSLLRRALELVAEPDLHLETAFAMTQPDIRAAARLLGEIAGRAEARADAAGAALALALAAYMANWAAEGSLDEEERLALAAIPLLEARLDHAGLAEVWFALASSVYRCRYERMVEAAERARHHEALAGMPHRSDAMQALGLQLGPRPVDEALERCAALEPRWNIDLSRAFLLAMSGRIDEARTLADAAAKHARELGHTADPWLAEIEKLAGNHEGASELLRSLCDRLAGRGFDAPLAAYAGLRGRELCSLDRYDEADELAAKARDHAHKDDLVTQAFWRQAAAIVQAHRGAHPEAERLAREAVAFARETDSPRVQGDALSDLAEVLAAAGQNAEAASALREALELYERKQVIPLARRARERLAAVEPVSA